MRTSVRDVFAVAAATYDRGNPLLLVEREETPALLPHLGGQDVLDLGAGRGHYARLARALEARRVFALDLTPEMLEAAPKPALAGDAARLPLREACVDVVIAALVLSYVGDRVAALREVARVLRPGGALVLSDLHPMASRLGWRRSFEGPAGERVVAEAQPLSAEELSAELEGAGLAPEAWREAAVDDRLEGEFRRAGRTDFASLRGTPLLLLVRARKGRS